MIAERTWKGEILVADIEELEKHGRSRNPCSKNQCKRRVNANQG